MNKYFSDFLPPALVRDLRRSLRTRGYLAMLTVFLLVAAWLQFDSIQEDPVIGETPYPLSLIGLLVMWFIIPSRAGNSVAADAKAKGSNFMMLTPLTSREIVWGTWVSAVFQQLVVAGVGALIVWWRAGTLPEPFARNLWGCYGVLVGGGAVMSAVFLFMSQLSRFMRMLLGVSVVLVSWQVVLSLVEMAMVVRDFDPMANFLSCFEGESLYVILADTVLVIVLLLEFARRSYAAPAENCSRSVRVLALLVPASVPLLYYYLSESVGEGQLWFAACYSIMACMSDALLPTYSLVAHDKRAWPLVPAYLQVPGVGQAALFLLPVLGLLAWLFCRYTSVADKSLPDVYQVLLWVQMAYTLLITLLVTDLLCKRDSVNRPVVYALSAAPLSLLSVTVHFMVPASLRMYVSAALPFSYPMLLEDYALSQYTRSVPNSEMFEVEPIWQVVISAVALVLTLLLLMWRGRRG
ncbi:MAG: hypothetical protein IJ943_09985 [Akkermansia sp.]|nr:hypothetical protein [Akkermansia sp.]